MECGKNELIIRLFHVTKISISFGVPRFGYERQISTFPMAFNSNSRTSILLSAKFQRFEHFFERCSRCGFASITS